MRVRWFCFLIFAFLCLSSPTGVSAQDIQTRIGMNGRGILFVSRQFNRVNVILEPILTIYDWYDFDQIEQFDFQWIIPLPVPPIEEPDAVFSIPGAIPYFHKEFDQLDDLTQVRFEPDVPRYCYDTFEYIGRSGDASYPADLIAQETDYAVVPNGDLDTVLHQLREEGYAIAADDVPRLQQYVEAGLSFLAVKYHLDAEEQPGAYQYTIYGAPFAFSFQWSEEEIPLTFSRYSTIWIFSDQGYRSVNIPHVLPEYSQFLAPHSIANTGDFLYYDNNYYPSMADRQYQEEMRHILTDGSIVTEYAGSTDIVEALDDTEILSWAIKDKPYVSRFVVRSSDTIPYPIFEPAPDQPDRSNVIDLSAYVDPLAYWGCSSRTALDESTLTNLPAGRRRFDDLRFAVAYPPDWQLSTLTSDDGMIYGFSPETLTLDAVSAAMNGDPDQPPMFLFSEHTYITDGFAGPLLIEQNLLTQLNIETVRFPWFRNLVVRFDMRQVEMQQEHGVMYGIIANETDWAENEAMYKAMLAYAQSYQYFASAEWPHTLFIQSGRRAETVITLEIPYPDGWIEQMDGNDIVISDETAELRLIPAAAATSDLLQQRYDLTGNLSCEQPTQFQANGREGYVFPTTGYLAEVSISAGEIAEYESLLLKMLAALPDTCAM